MKQIEKYKKEILIGVGLLFAIILLKKNWWRVEKFFKPAARNNSPNPLTDTRKNQLESLAGEMYSDIESTGWTGHNYEPYNKAVMLFDDEIEYLADYYKNYQSQGLSLLKAMQTQSYWWGDSPAKLMSKLKELNKN